MKAFTTLVSLLTVGSLAMAVPVNEDDAVYPPEDGAELIPRTDLFARGYGCPFSSNQCAFHCKNDVVKHCNNGKKLKPSGGTCGGWGWHTCKCEYKKNC